jgi:hypothetical protein
MEKNTGQCQAKNQIKHGEHSDIIIIIVIIIACLSCISRVLP